MTSLVWRKSSGMAEEDRVEVKQRLRRRRKATKTRENWPNEKWELDAKHPLQMSVSDWYELWLTSHVIAHYAEHVCIERNATHVPYMYHYNDVILYSLAAKVGKSITLLHWKTVEKFGRQIEWTDRPGGRRQIACRFIKIYDTIEGQSDWRLSFTNSTLNSSTLQAVISKAQMPHIDCQLITTTSII